MGASQSLDALFGSPNFQSDSEQADVYQYLRRMEKTLWLSGPWWEHERDVLEIEAADARARSPSKRSTTPRDPLKRMTPHEALVALPAMLDEMWVSPLVALVDCVDPIARSAGLALLSRIVQRDSVAKIFIAVRGMNKVMALLDSQDQQATYLALEVIFALCAGSPSVILPFCEAGLIGRLTELAKGENWELVLASLKVLRLTLRQNAVKAELPACKLLSVLMELVHSPHAAIAKTAITCIGLSLPNAENLAEILRLGCIDIFLRLMTPSNANADAVIFALSLIADETDTIFPREQTTTTLGRMLETLRGAAKRSPSASATSFLFASLAKSSIFHIAICTETNLGILAKLLVGGSPEVLGSTAYALGIVAIHANDRVRQILFQVDAPQNLMQLVILSLATAGPGRDERVARLAIFALGTVTSEALVSRTGTLVRPELLLPSSGASEPLRISTIASCGNMQGADFLPHVYARAITRRGAGSTYALKLLAALSTAPHVKEHMCEATSVSIMLEYLRGASAVFLPSLLVLFLECCSCDHDCACGEIASQDEVEVPGSSLAFSKLVESTPDAMQILGALFQNHQPEHLFGLAPLLGALAAHSALLSEHMSSSTFFVDQALSIATRLNHEALHEQVLKFLDGLTAHKNTRALEQLFASDPDRIANLLQASLSTRVQLLAATLLRRLFKRLNLLDVPSRAAQRHLAKLLAASSGDLLVAVAACRVWGNLFQYEDKRLAFAQIPDSVSGLLQLLQRCIGSQPADDAPLTAMIQVSANSSQGLEVQEKRSVPPGLKPLYWVIRSTFRTAYCEITKQSIVAAPHFLSIVALFPHACDPIARLAIDTMSELARAKTPGLRRALAVPTVLNSIQDLLRDRERASTGLGVLPQRHVLRFLGLLARKDAAIQHFVVESRLLEALLLLMHSPSTALNAELLAEALDALAWVCSAARSPTDIQAQAEIEDETEIENSVEGEAPARRVVATAKMVDFSLRHADSAIAPVARASLHLLQRLACEQPVVPRCVFDANGASVVMRALQQRPEHEVRRRASGLVRHLVHKHDGNRQQFQELGATSFLVALVCEAKEVPEYTTDQKAARKPQIKGLQALAALCEGSGSAARASKKELLECDQSAELVRLVSVNDTQDERFCAAWTRALAMGAYASSTNQRRLVSAGIVPLLTKLLRHPSGRVRVPTAQLLAYLAEAPENRGIILNEGGEALLAAVIAGLQSELPGLQRYTALFVANAATRHEGNKVRLGATGAAAPLVDRLSSQRRHVLENVLLAVVKLGSHAGNKVKLGGKVCFEKLLSLVHHETLGVAKGAARALAVLVVGNDANKKFLLQCEAPVVAELSALLKGSNGTIVESAMLVLGELAPMPAQALELSRCVDVLSVVRLLTHINPRIARAALMVVRHLTRESFNKTRFGLRECVEALLARLRVGLGGTSGADELEMVELTITCLVNLSFASSNASRIAEAKDHRSGSLLLLLQLAASALPAQVKDYLSEKEIARLMSSEDVESPPKAASPGKSPLRGASPVDTENNSPSWPIQEEDDEEMYESMARNSPKKSADARGGSPRREKSDEARDAEVESPPQTLDFSAFPSVQTAVLEQTLLVLSNCADNYRSAKAVDILAVAVLCQALLHSSELVARCGCYTLACWLKKNSTLQDAATRRGALQALAKLLTSTSLMVVEAAAYVLSKLAARGDNPMKLLALDVPATLVHGILRKPANVPHDRVLDRAVRLLGTLVQFSRVRQSLKGEEIIADVLTPLLQLHPQTLGKNLSRLVLALLADDSLKFFLPKKTVSLLRACFVHEATNAKTIRNVLRIFALLVTVEEHKTTITLEDCGEALGRMVQELRIEEGVLGENDETVLGLLACIAGTRRIAVILHENDVYVRLPPYILVPEQADNDPLPTDKGQVDTTVELRRLHTVQIAARLCKALGDQAVRRLSELEFTSLLLELLRVGLPPPPLPEVEGEVSAPPASGSPTTLSLLAWECIDVLRQLSPWGYDEQVFAEEGGVEVLVTYFELWLDVASGNAPDSFPTEGGDNLVSAFAVSLAAIVRTLSGQTPNRELLVQGGGFPLVLKALGLGSLELPEPQREQLAEALAGLTALPIMAPYFEASPDLVAPLFRFMVAPQTQQRAHLLLLALRAFADVMEVSPASRAFVLLITGGTIQPLPFLLSCLECSTVSASDDSVLRLLHTMRSLQRLVTDEAIARAIAALDGLPAIGKLLSLTLPALPTYDDRLDIVQLMVTETLGYMAFFGHAPRLRLERSAIARLLAQDDYANNERVKPEGVATSIWTLALLATPQVPSEDADVRAEVVATAQGVRGWVWEDTRGLDVLIRCGLRAPDYLNLPTSVTSDVLAVLTTATETEPEAETVLSQLVQKQVCTPVASLLEAVEPVVRCPALQLLARTLNKQSWAANEPLETANSPGKERTGSRNGGGEGRSENWSAVLLHLAEWMQVYAQDPQSSPLSELRDAYSSLSVLTAHSELAAQFQRGEAPRGLIDLVATALHHFGGKKLPSRPESLALIRKESACSEEASPTKTSDVVERARADWALQFETVLPALRVCRRMMSFSSELSEKALALHVPRALDNLVLLHDRRILDEVLRCMLHLATLHGEDTELLFSSDRTVARLKGLLQTESRPLQARITPILALMAANMPTLPGLCAMDGILILADLAVSSSSLDIIVKNGGDASTPLNRRVFEDSCTMLHVLFSQEEGIILAFDVAQVVSKLFGIVENVTTAVIAALDNDADEAPELLHLPLSVLVKVSAVAAAHVRYLELLPRICRLLDGEHGPAQLTGRWCEMLLSILYNVFGCPFGSNAAVCKASTDTLAQGKRTLLPQLLPLERWLSVVDTFPALGRFVIELIRAFVGNAESSSPYATLFNSGEDIPALLKLVGSSSDDVAIPSAQLLLAVLKQREVRVALIVADGVPALVVALCQARNVKVQNLLLALILDLSRGDTEVQALLLVAPGCVARLVEFIQEWVDARATADTKETAAGLDKRLALTCTLLTELSRALHGPERIVEVNGHLPLLALSIQQQQDDDVQGAQTTIQILTNLAIADMTVAPGLAASKLPAHFLSCVLSDEKEAGRTSQKNALPLKRRLALSGLVALAKANRELRATLARSGPLVVLLESLLQKPEEGLSAKRAEESSSISRDALLLLYLMSTAGCIELVGHSSPEILTRICSVVSHHLALHLGRNGDTVQDEEATPVEVTRGLKLLANLLDVAYQQERKMSWHPEELLKLAPLLETRVATHQTPKRQLPALRVIRGAFSLMSVEDPTQSFYYPLSPKLLAELLTVLLVSPSRQHHDIAEKIIVSAFQNDPERARESVGDNQILEQLLIVFTQPGNDAAQRTSDLAVVLTQVLYVSIARGFVVSQRFLAKLPALLASYAHEALLAEGDDVNQPLKRALSIYLSFVHSSCPPTSAMRSGISDMLRSEGDSRRALIVLIHQLLLIHPALCLTTNPSGITLSHEDVILWTCIVESVSPLTPALAALFTAQVPTTTWMCLLRDWFNWVGATERPENELLRNSCRMLSVVAHLPTTEEETEELLTESRSGLSSQCLAVLSCGGDVLAPRVIEGALQALMDVREAWGDTFVLTGCSTFAGTTALLPKLLHIFRVPEREANRSRHLVLQLLLLLASTGYFIEEMKAAGARSAVENNPLVSPDDKALPVALLGMLGYSADLNEEFARALEQFDAARSELERRERVAYLLRFLERYALTHAPTKEQAIDSFMTYLVADAEKAQAAAMATEREPEVTKGEQTSADQLALTIASDCLASLVKIAGWSPTPDLSLSTTLQSGFGELYLSRWDLNALLAVAFARQRGDEDNDFQERPRLAVSQVAQVLELAALVRAQLDENAQSGESDAVVVGQIDARWLCNAFMLVTGANSQPGSGDLLLVEQILALLHWLAVNSSTCFEDICRYAVLLRAFLAPLTPIFCGGINSESDIAHGAMELFLSLVEMVVNTPTPGAETTASIDELLVDLIKFLYAQVDKGLLMGVRARLLLCVLVILQRTGDAGRAACVAYERAMQQIMWHIHAAPATELQARCSWELLGSLSEMDPAITALFNLDAIPILLRECGCDPNVQPSSPSWRQSKRAVAFRQAEALKCLSRAARTHDEVLLKIGEAPGIAAVLFGALAAGPAGKNEPVKGRKPSTKEPPAVDSAGTQAHAAHLIARIAAQEDLRASLVSPENISLLIESLESVHLPVVLHALQALAHLCAFSLCLDALVRNATVPVLAQILFSPLVATPRRREIEACVVALLGKMCDRSQIVSRRIVSSNLLPKLREFLVVEKQLKYTQQEPQPGEFGVHNNAVSIIYSLSKDAELLPKLVSNGILETLCDQVLDYDQNTTQRKALGAVSRLASVADMDAAFLQFMIAQVVESVRRSVPVPEAHRTVTNALAVFVAIIKGAKNRHIQQRQQRRPQSQQQQQRNHGNGDDEVNIRELLLKGEGLRVALDLLGASELRVKLEAFRVVSEFVEDHPNFDEVRELLLGSEEQGGSHALLSLVRALSDEARSATAAMTSALPSARSRGKNDLLLVVMVFLNMLIADETLKVKLTPTTYDVVLQVVVAMSSATSSQQRVLAESLKALTTMTRAGQMTDLCPEAALVNSVEPLVKVLRELGDAEGGAGNTTMRLNALFLLVNFASSAQCRGRMAHRGALEVLLGIIQYPGGGGLSQDEQLVQLSLLGVALMTTGGVSDAAAVVELSRSVDTLVRLLSSKSASIQANAVWVVSNISSEASLKDAIVARGGPTALQAVLNDSMSIESAIAAQLQRPSSSTMRIREYAPKAIKALGFAPIMPPGAPSIQ